MSKEFIDGVVLGDIVVGDGATAIGQVPGSGSVRLGQQGGEAAATIGRAVVSVVADLTDVNRRDVSNTLEFASRYADTMVLSKGGDVASESWSWFHHYVAAISNLGWTACSFGPQDVDPEKMPQAAGSTAVADIITGIVNADSRFDLEDRQLIHRTIHTMKLGAPMNTGTIQMSNRPTISEGEWSFTVTAARIMDGVLTMRTIGVGFRPTEDPVQGNANSARSVGPSQPMRKEIVDFTAIQSLLDAHREHIEWKLQNSIGDYTEDTLLD